MSGQRHSHLQVLERDTPTAGLLLPPPPSPPTAAGTELLQGGHPWGPCSPWTPPAPGGQHQGFQRSWATGRETKSNPQGLGSMPHWLAPASLVGFPSPSSSSF